jgi:chromate transporter
MVEIARVFFALGSTSFGGPIAHIAYFREEFVTRRRWLDEQSFASLVALCQFLPGPASSQVAYGLGAMRAGALGGVVASCAFLVPSVVVMVAWAYAEWFVSHGARPVSLAMEAAVAGIAHGFALVAVVVVANAVVGMARTLCVDGPRRVVAVVAGGVCVWVAWAGGESSSTIAAVAQVGSIVMGAAIGMACRSGGPAPSVRDVAAGGAWDESRTRAACSGRVGVGHAASARVLLCVAVCAVVAVWASRAVPDRDPRLAQADAMVTSGALVFGGGHVVLPMLHQRVVDGERAWITDERFVAGYGVAQAVPGPLFSFAAYLGTAMSLDPPTRYTEGAAFAPAAVGGLVCVVAIFVPGWILIGVAMPLWGRVQRWSGAWHAIRGANAAVVGILAAAWCVPVVGSVFANRVWQGDQQSSAAGVDGYFVAIDALVCVAAGAGLIAGRVPVWFCIGGLALYGMAGGLAKVVL